MGIEKYIGNRYSKLVVIDVKRENKNTYCLCECDCKGEESVKWIRLESLTRGETRSCGCFNKTIAIENLNKMFPSYSKRVFIDGTNLNSIKDNLPLKNNSTGYRGVSFDKERNKYAAYIEFKKKRYYLGRFDTAEDASIAYQLAKKELHNNFLEWYETEFKPIQKPSGASYKIKISEYSISNPQLTMKKIAEHFKCTDKYVRISLQYTDTYEKYKELHKLSKISPTD